MSRLSISCGLCQDDDGLLVDDANDQVVVYGANHKWTGRLPVSPNSTTALLDWDDCRNDDDKHGHDHDGLQEEKQWHVQDNQQQPQQVPIAALDDSDEDDEEQAGLNSYQSLQQSPPERMQSTHTSPEIPPIANASLAQLFLCGSCDTSSDQQAGTPLWRAASQEWSRTCHSPSFVAQCTAYDGDHQQTQQEEDDSSLVDPTTPSVTSNHPAMPFGSCSCTCPATNSTTPPRPPLHHASKFAEEEDNATRPLPRFLASRVSCLAAQRRAAQDCDGSADTADLVLQPEQEHQMQLQLLQPLDCGPVLPAIVDATAHVAASSSSSFDSWYSYYEDPFMSDEPMLLSSNPCAGVSSSHLSSEPTAYYGIDLDAWFATPKWKGHLPLGPEYPVPDPRIRRGLRRCRSMPSRRNGSAAAAHHYQRHLVDISLPQDAACTTTAATTTCSPSSSFERPLPVVPISVQGQDDTEMIFLSNEDQASPAASADSSKSSKGSSGSGAGDDKSKIRRPPGPQSSLSVPSDAGHKSKKGDPHLHGKHKVPKGTMDLEQIQVKTPGADRSALKELPALRDAPPTKREELFVLKLKLCSVIFSFDDPTADKRGKDMKRQTLLELVDYVNTPAGQKIFTESVMSDLMAMVSANVCRALPPATDDFDPEEDEPVLEPAWPHLQVAYEFFLRFIVSSEVNAKAAKKYVDQKFCLQLVELFDSEDPRERDYLKTILHRIYGKFMSHRSFIRRAISNVFYRFVYETERHNGIGELLEILGSIINGFAIPLKKEHLQFLVRALIPLHKPKCVALYHQQLSYCIIQYVEKDADTATPILNGFFKCWPWSSSAKQVMFLNELEEILELLGADQLAQVSTMLFTNLARCLDSDHFQVVERALFLWNNEHLVNSGCLSRLNAQTVLPIIYRPLYKNSAGHWNATVEGLAQNVLKMYMEYDLVLYDKCTKAYYREEEDAKRKLEALEAQWLLVEKSAAAAMPAAITAK